MAITETEHPPPARPPLHTLLAQRVWAYLRGSATDAAGAVARVPGVAGAQGRDLFRKLADREPKTALSLVRKARRGLRASPWLARAEAVLTARAEGWQVAAPLFRALGPASAPGDGAWASLLRGREAPVLDLALPDPDRAADLDPESAAEMVVYTAVFGDTPPPAPVFHAMPGLRFVCLTDRPEQTVHGWESHAAAPEGIDPAIDPDLAGAWCRIHAETALADAAPAARASLWLDPDRRPVGNLHTLFNRWCRAHDLVLWRHQHGIDWHDLAEARLLADPDATGVLLAQAEDCAARGLARNTGAWDTGMIWRRHGTGPVAALMAAWWETLARVPGDDALALAAVLADPDMRAKAAPRTLPVALGPAADNAFVLTLPAPPARAPVTPPTRRKLAFVYAEEHATTASTFLRGRQLSEMIAARFPDRYEVTYTSDLGALKDHVVLLTKGALQVHSAATLADLRRRNIALLGNWDDQVPIADKVAATDASLTISHRQTRDMVARFPDVPTFYITHHVNRQVRPLTPPDDRLRAGYFGDMGNTICPASLGHLVELVGTNTVRVDSTWIDELPRFNCHWIVRKRRPFDGAKPFLKGFLAARCGAVVVVARDEEDVLTYLGDDYPFFVSGLDPATLEADMAEIAAAFGGPDWRRAQAIMAQVAARSSDDVVCAEFQAMMEAVIG